MRNTALKALTLFFFSSRRRHTRSLCDWSSDVCSSDLARVGRATDGVPPRMNRIRMAVVGVGHLGKEHARVLSSFPDVELIEIGRASCRERVEVSGRAVSVKAR